MSDKKRRNFIVGFVATFVATNLMKIPKPFAKSDPNPAKNHQIEIKSLKFSPSKVEVGVGDTITWTNKDIAPHTATAQDKSWDTGKLNRGESKTITVTEEFSANYYCRFHPNMKAKLILKS